MKCPHEKLQIWPDIYIGPGCDCNTQTQEDETEQ